MRLQIVSDIHLEFRNNRYPFIARKAPHIALLGDIGRPFSSVYARFIRDLSRRFYTVIIIAGNHEFYSSTNRIINVGQIHEKIISYTQQYSNVHYLQNQTMFIDGVRILGATLWTDLPTDIWKLVRKKMNDYQLCYIDSYPEINLGVPLAPEHTTNWHHETVQWLKEELVAPGYSNTPTIILSHHAPYHLNTSDSCYDDQPLRCCYSTDLSCLFAKPVIAWAYGHTHYPNDQVVNGVRLVSNPLGYPGEIEHAEEFATNNPPVIEFRPPPGLVASE